jgi:hypothetical protein
MSDRYLTTKNTKVGSNKFKILFRVLRALRG